MTPAFSAAAMPGCPAGSLWVHTLASPFLGGKSKVFVRPPQGPWAHVEIRAQA